MNLDVDVGNTRAKWYVLDRGRVVAQGAFNSEEFALMSNVHDKLVLGCSAFKHKISRIRVACVRGDDYREVLSSCLLGVFGVHVEYAQTTSCACGVNNSYEDPDRMGVDRWAAIVAAVECEKKLSNLGHCCVVDAGSALTIDFVKGGIQHKGGYIVPGFQLQKSALFAGTEKVEVRNERDVCSISPGCNTSDAVSSGILASMVSLVELSAMRFGDKLDQPVSVYLTGGDADLLQSVSRLSMISRSNLVLEGLEYLLP